MFSVARDGITMAKKKLVTDNVNEIWCSITMWSRRSNQILVSFCLLFIL